MRRISEEEARALVREPAERLMPRAEALTLDGFGHHVSYSKKVFVPLTRLCRDVCGYCTFARPPRGGTPYLSLDEALEIARAGAAAGCKEVLFTLGDKPELRYPAAAEALAAMGHATTLDYLGEAARAVRDETGLLPHLNPGVMSAEELARLRPASASMGIMLETLSDRLSGRGGPHWRSPDKEASVRLATIESAGELAIPFTSGLLVGIGETREERIAALLALRDIQDRYGHIQELIIQNFRAKPNTRMAKAPDAPLDEQLWTIAAARLIFGTSMTLQAPPNLQPGALEALVRAGVNDWGGVSPVTPDHVNPEAPWPALVALAEQTAAAGRVLTERLAIAPKYVADLDRWADPAMRPKIRAHAVADGLARSTRWNAGEGTPPPQAVVALIGKATQGTREIERSIARAERGERLEPSEIARLFTARGEDFSRITAAADALREKVVGETVTYVVNRNINYTNICLYRCGFCAFSKGKTHEDLRGKPYRLDLEEVARRTVEARALGATEVCLQGGIHPEFTGETYLSIAGAVKAAVPEIHIHAFSPLEVTHGAQTLGLSLEAYLGRLQEAGLDSLPGTAAEILHDDIRKIICPDKLTTDEWLAVLRAAHRTGLRTTSTIMFGHVERPEHWAAHLLALRDLQEETGGITEFVPLPFVHREAPIARKGLSRHGPSFREAVLMHSIGRLVFHGLIHNVQASWVKLGMDGVVACLRAGANDAGGTLIDESITRAAGGVNGQAQTPADFAAAAASIGRVAVERTMKYERRETVGAD
jgi:FO synthase